MAYTPDFAQLLQAGFTFDADWGSATAVIEPFELDKAVLPTGRIVGCDPLVNPGADPYTVAVPPGSYPVIAWVAVFAEDGAERDRRVAALELRISDSPAASWDMAVTDAQSKVKDLGGDDFIGYPVDAGCGTLADVAALRPVADWEYEQIEDVLIGPMAQGGPVPGRVHAVTDPATGANVIAVCSGWGDGVYPTFIGRDARGEVTGFVTDFLVLPFESETEASTRGGRMAAARFLMRLGRRRPRRRSPR